MPTIITQTKADVKVVKAESVWYNSQKGGVEVLEYVEVQPLPKECEGCTEGDCYNCDYALERWHLTEESEKHLQDLWEQYKRKRRKNNG